MLGITGESEARRNSANGGTYLDLLPLGWRKNGLPIYPILGGAEEEEEKDENGNPINKSSAGTDEGKSGVPDTATTVAKDEYDRLFARMQAADRNQAELTAKLKAAEDKDKSELERAKSDVAEKSEVLATLSAQVREQAIKLAAMTSVTNIVWHDPADALAFMMRDEQVAALELKNGEVDSSAVKAAAERLARNKPYLVKSTSEGKTDESQGKKVETKTDDTPSGGGGTKGKDGKDGPPSRDVLAQKYPALRR